MTRRDTLLVMAIGLLVALAAAAFVRVPGYMDADYYYAGGLRLNQGYGFTEPHLWNYLDDPTTLPHPSHIYWMPLASLLSAAGLLLRPDFTGARLPFLALAAVLPLVTARLASALGGRRRTALLAGALAAASGFYLPYLVTTETFGIYMLAGAGFLLVAAPGAGSRWAGLPAILRFLTLGLLAGLMHLARADGLLWLGAAGLVWLVAQVGARRAETFRFRIAIDSALGLAAGYLLVMGFWYARNLAVFGALMPPGNSRALWLTDYDQMFTASPQALTAQAYFSAGLARLISLRWDALLQNLQSALAVQGQVVLLPLALVGGWSIRRDARVRWGALLWLLIFAFMTLVFPLAGARGGFFHSGAALQLLIWACAAIGFDQAIRWAAGLRGWNPDRAFRIFAPTLLAVLLVMTAGLYLTRVIGDQPGRLKWQQGWDDYRQVEQLLVSLGAQPGQSVAVSNPPGYFAATGRAAIVIPDGDVTGLVKTARRFHAGYVILEENHVRGLEALYSHPISAGDLIYLRSTGTMQLYKIYYPT